MIIQIMENESSNTNSEIDLKKRKKLKRNRGDINFEQSKLPNSPEIDNCDLEELKSVYSKCKAVLKKIEAKYGHLLSANDDLQYETENLGTCTCKFNKKTVFDDEGRQITQEVIPDMHICPKKQEVNSVSHIKVSKPSIQIEQREDSLPNNIKELSDILKNDNIDIVHRNEVIEKIRAIKEDNLNIIRFDRKLLIERTKLNPDELMEFKGSNISSLSGYPTKRLKNL
ncbi:unnamed protein product [Leptosia nina]|uniref:Uncharacterized protein n=1 Tax=Leptosia nina TaxID=320188 RepID=A0AAV1J800_9NEOP